MRQVGNILAELLRDESGASAAEYALVAGLVSLVIILGLGLAGNTMSHLFNQIGTEISNVTP